MKKFIKAISFLLILIIFLVNLNRVFKFKYGDGIYGLEKFYSLDAESVDLLVLGSSHAFEDINPAVLWMEQGIAAYDLCGSVQPMWNTYFYLKEALKTQKPKMIILEGYMLSFDENYSDDSRIIKNNYGLKNTKDKWDSLKVSCPKDNFYDFALEIGQYHNRYTDITKEDFLKNQGNPLFENWKGNGNNRVINSFDKPQVAQIEDALPLNSKTEKYYRAILQLANDNNIKIMVVVSPYPGITETNQKKYNMGKIIADEYKVPFYNFNNMYDEIDLDFSKDFADTDHLNNYGNYKFTKYLCEILQNEYADYVIDRRNDSNYASWEKMSQFYQREEFNYNVMLNYNELNQYLGLLSDTNYLCVVLVNNSNEAYDNEISIFGENYNYYIYNKGKLLADSYDKGNTFSYSISKYNDIAIDLENCEIIYNRNDYKKVDNGINIFIYDYVTDTVVTAVGFDATQDLQIIK